MEHRILRGGLSSGKIDLTECWSGPRGIKCQAHDTGTVGFPSTDRASRLCTRPLNVNVRREIS